MNPTRPDAHEPWPAWAAAGVLGCSGRHSCNKAYVERRFGREFSEIGANFKFQLLIDLQPQWLSFFRPQVRGEWLGYFLLSIKEVLGNSFGEGFAYAVGDSEAEAFCGQFLGSLIATGFCEAVKLGLTGTRLVICDAHLGLTAAIKRMFQGCCWRRTGRCAG
jgi:hypothetical protein